MGVIEEKWRCPKCKVDVGESMGEFRKHVKRVHTATPRLETRTTRVAAA
jgi:hypothetical protein